MHNHHPCFPQLPPPPIKVIYSAALRKQIMGQTIQLRSWVCLDPEAYGFCSPFQSSILPVSTFSTSDVTCSHPHGNNAAPKEPGVKSCLETTSQRRDDFLLICYENISAHNGRSPYICVCVCLGPRSWSAHGPTLHSSCVTVCLACSASEFFHDKRKKKGGGGESCQDSDSVYLVSLFTISPVRKEAPQKRAFQTQTSGSHPLLYAAHLQLSVRKKTGHVSESLPA